MALHEEKHGAVTVLRPEGPMAGADEAEQFKTRILELFNASLGRCVVDVSAVPYVDSRALESLVEANEEMSHSGQVLKLCGANETIRQVLELTELSSQFEHFADVNAGVRSFL